MYWLYEKTPLDNGTHLYENRRHQALAGNKNGVFFRAYKAGNGRDGEIWYASKRDLLSVLGCTPETHALVIDIAPKRRGERTLHEIRGVAGITANGWTPIMWLDEDLSPGKPPPAGNSVDD